MDQPSGAFTQKKNSHYLHLSVPYRGILVYIFGLVSVRLSFFDQSDKNKVLNIESALHSELSSENLNSIYQIISEQ